MNREATVWLADQLAGSIADTDEGYEFSYDHQFLTSPNVQAISLTLPLTPTPYRSTVLFPFFDGLIPEGWLLAIAEQNWKLQPTDRFGLLLACCQDCIGAVSIIPVSTGE